MSFTSKTDDEIIKLANPIWLNLIKSSNMKDYGGFTRDFSSQMLYGANEVELGKQWASNKLISSLTDNFKAFGCLRRGMHVTVLFKQTSTTEEGEFLGRLVLGEEGDAVKVFGAGDTVGGSAHKFSSGSFTEGRLAAKAAVKYIEDKKANNIKLSEKQYNDLKEVIYKPLENYTVGRNEITGGTVSPSYISPIQGLQRLQKIMDEYCGCITNNYMTNDNLLKKGLELLDWLQEDLENVGAEDYHQLMRAWELKHRALTSQCVTEHTLFREETRWPGYYYRGDHMILDDENWHCLTVSRRDPETGKFTMEKKPVYHIVDGKEKKKAS